MNIGFYFSNADISDVDMRFPEKGNPGIGGTPYSFTLLSKYLSIFKSNMNITLYIDSPGLMPKGIVMKIVTDIFHAIEEASNDSIDIFIFRPQNDIRIFESLNKKSLKSITWGHNFYNSKLAKYISECDSVKRNVFVGKEQYDRYIDHSIISKSTFIFNSLSLYNSNVLRENDCLTVTYIGSIVPSKGFHVLAKQWKKILNEIPNARLNVIGTGQVYSRKAELGKYGIAEESYERKFIKYITNNNGEILDSINFLGLLGFNKIDYILATSVGVVNPTARTETFGISAIEMEMYGVPVVTKKCNGFLDTIINGKTGILYNYERNLAKNIIRLLNDREINNKYGNNAKNFVLNNFNVEKITEEWVIVFEEVLCDIKAKIIMPNKNYLNNLKWLRILNFYVKKIYVFRKIPSVIDIEYYVMDLFKEFKKI